MSGGFPALNELSNGVSEGAVLASFSYGGTSVQPGATANVKGSWVQLVASSPFDAALLVVQLQGVSNTGVYYDTVFDVGIGSSGNETPIANNLLLSFPNGQYMTSYAKYHLPIAIPKGTRISARNAANLAGVAAGDNQIILQLFDANTVEAGAGVDAIGFVSATTQGTVITPGNAVKGSYAQITAATARDYSGFIIATDSDLGASGANNSAVDLDVAIGGSGSEVIIVPDVGLGISFAGCGLSGRFDIPIPAGSRIAVRAANTSNVVTGFGVIIYGVY